MTEQCLTCIIFSRFSGRTDTGMAISFSFICGIFGRFCFCGKLAKYSLCLLSLLPAILDPPLPLVMTNLQNGKSFHLTRPLNSAFLSELLLL